MVGKIIRHGDREYIETKKCCACGKTLPDKSDQFALNEKQVVCSACWNGPDDPRDKSGTHPTFSLVEFPYKSFR